MADSFEDWYRGEFPLARVNADTTLRHQLRQAYQAGHSAGERAMRERAAKECIDRYQRNKGQRIHGTGIYFEECATAIRALPIEE